MTLIIWNTEAKRNRKILEGTMKKFAKKFIQNELRILMTRGVHGLYIYVCDDELRKRLKECLEYKASKDKSTVKLDMKIKAAEEDNEYRIK